MAKIKILAGSFPKGEAYIYFGQITLPGQSSAIAFNHFLRDLEEIDVASEENVKKVGGTLGWGAAGAILLGPAGLLAGLLLGGKKKEVTFVAKFKDDKKMLGSTDSETYKTMMASIFK